MIENDDFFDVDILYVALSVLSYRSPNSVIPEVLLFLTSEQVMTFLQVFGGKTIKVPTPKELSKSLQIAIAAHMRLHKKYTWPKIEEELGIDGRRSRAYKAKIDKWLEHIEREGIEIPGILSPNMRKQSND